MPSRWAISMDQRERWCSSTRAAAYSTANFRRARGPRYRLSTPKRQAGTGHQRHRPHLHDAFDDPFATLNRELEACPLRARRMPSGRLSLRSDQRKQRRIFLRRPRQFVAAPHMVPTADHQIFPAAPLYDRRA